MHFSDGLSAASDQGKSSLVRGKHDYWILGNQTKVTHVSALLDFLS